MKQTTSFTVRGVSSETLHALTTIAKEKGVSRNEYIKTVLETAALSPKITLLEERHNVLLQQLLQTMLYHNEQHAEVLLRLEKLERNENE